MRGTTIELLWSHGIVCPLVRRSSRCAWGFYVAWKAGLHHKALFPHSTPERQSLCESHRQRRWLTHWSQLFSTEPLVARSCRMDYTTCYCRSPQCPMYGQIAPRAHVKMHDWQRQGTRFSCARCGGIVSATTGTAYAGIRTDLTTYLRGATALAEGLSIRATGRLLDVDKDTANQWLPVLGQHCQGVMNYFFRNLHLHECQLDELWTFIHKKEGRLTSLEKLAEVYGDTWVWI